MPLNYHELLFFVVLAAIEVEFKQGIKGCH